VQWSHTCSRPDHESPEVRDHVRPPTDMNFSAVDREHKSFDAVPVSARSARQFVSDTLCVHGASTGIISDYALAVSELASNIIEHGNGSSLSIYLDVTDPEWWDVEVVGGSVTSPDTLPEPDMWRVAAADEPSGRGLGIVRHLMDNITAVTSGDQISIRCRKRRRTS
jgi:anti-sigma regulatory factor (Ser/Thr protein kinase)